MYCYDCNKTHTTTSATRKCATITRVRAQVEREQADDRRRFRQLLREAAERIESATACAPTYQDGCDVAPLAAHLRQLISRI